MQECFNFQEKKFTVSTSIGIVFFNDSVYTADELLSLADNALYTAKESGRNTFRISDLKNP